MADTPPRAPSCPADRLALGDPNRDCDGPASYYCDELECGAVARRWKGVRYVVDVDGELWRVVRGGIVVRVVTERWKPDRVHSAGIAWLEREHGPVLPFDPAAYRESYPRAEAST